MITAQVKKRKVPVIHNNGAHVGRDASLAGAEYRLTGQATFWSAKDAPFLQELIGYLRTHNLSDLLSLQILPPKEPGKAMVEFVLGGNCGTVMLDHEKANFQGAYRNTRWRVEKRR
ncbi:hypothetical protein EDB80DRAFT_900006, partial [Ilyonectria destructans]